MMFEENAESPAVPMIPLQSAPHPELRESRALEAVLTAAPVSLLHGAALDRVGRRLFVATFTATLSVHAALALGLLRAPPPVHRRPFASQVEVRMFHPPPPPPTPVVVPPEAARPPPPPSAALRRPAARPTLPVADHPVEDAIPVDTSAPASDEPATVGDPAPAAPVAVAPAPPPPPPPVIEAKEGANYLKNPRPPYPHLAVREGWQGSVNLRVRVLPTGRPDSIAVQRSSGRSVLDDAAVEAVKKWTFVPATQGGQAIAGWVTVPIEFRLQ